MTLVPNKFPRNSPSQRRLAIIGEAPGAEEEVSGEPFVGSSGRLLRFMIGSLNHSPDQCFIGNVCQTRPPSNDIEAFSYDGPEIQSGLAQLSQDLQAFRPNCVLCLGRTAFRAANPGVCGLDKSGKPYIPLGNWRGSLFTSSWGFKAVGTYHPAYILRVYGDSGLFRFDLARAVNQSAYPELTLPDRHYITRPSVCDVQTFCQRIVNENLTVAFDIEGICNNVGVTMLSLFVSPTEGIVVPFWFNGTHYWSAEDEATIWQTLAAVLSNPRIPKITQNGLYELFCLQWHHKLVVENISEDTMLKHWELFPEFEKSLAVQASIYTHEPYYKDDRTSPNIETKLHYNAKDSAVTFECSLVQDTLLRSVPRSDSHYRFNVSLLPAFNYMSLRGVHLDAEKLASKKSLIQKKIDSLQASVEKALGRKFNAKSVPDKKWLLYEYFDYTPYARLGTSTNEETLHRYYQKHRESVLKTVIQLVNQRTRRSDLEKLVADADGRLRCSYNPVGTVTGRLSSSASYAQVAYFTKTGILHWDQTGTNTQNQTKDIREVYTSDEGYFFFQCDLTGADAWTVAADLAALGHPTMLEDLRYGIRPPRVLLCMLQEHEAGRNPADFNQLSREEVKLQTNALVIPKGMLPDGRPGDWKYVCMKRVQHGTNYGMQPDKLSATIFKDSDGLIDLSTKDATFYQFLYRLRYNPDARITWVRSELARTGAIQCACGIRRKFYAIRSPRLVENSIVRDAAATEPQANTTFVCNQGLHALWYDPENRTSRGGLFVEPLIQIHDAIAGQFREKHLDWARSKIKNWMTYTLNIHGIPITIPFEGKFGKNWLALENDL